MSLNELLYVNYLVLNGETVKEVSNGVMKWMDAYESSGLKVILWKAKVMVCGGITMCGL